VNGHDYVHPVASAQYGLAAFLEWRRSGRRKWLDRALASGDDLRATANAQGLLPYDMPWWGPDEKPFPIPAYSAMAQGQALSLFVRLYRATHDRVWKQRARQAFHTMATPGSTGAKSVTFIDRDGYLWFEEYSLYCPGRVLNGHIFATFGILDYWKLTRDPRALPLFDAAVTTVVHYLPKLRNPCGISAYGVTQKRSHLAFYHAVHIKQLRTLERVTGRRILANWADRLSSDYPLNRLSASRNVKDSWGTECVWVRATDRHGSL
jgi:hypothetical protein